MSGICGLIHFDGRPAEEEQLRAMSDAMAHRGPDGITFAIAGNAGFAHLALHTTPEAAFERQPLHGAGQITLLAADLRVDNRAELLAEFAGHAIPREQEVVTDLDLLHAAYRRWGRACAQSIVGDYAYAVWDGTSQRLVLTRDAIGMRSLFYNWEGSTFFFATEIGAILAAREQPPALNDRLVADYLSFNFSGWLEETVYSGIHRLARGSHLLVEGNEARQERYWEYRLVPDIQDLPDEEYIARFRALFEESLTARLRSVGPVGISLSGGVDSSSMACLAHTLRTGETGSQVHLYGALYQSYEAADEREYFEAVARTCRGFPVTRLTGEDYWGFQSVHLPVRNGGLDEPAVSPHWSLLLALLQAARRDGCRIMLSGEGADQVLNKAAYYRPHTVLHLPWRQIGSELPHFWRHHGLSLVPAVVRSLVNNTGWRTWLPKAIANRIGATIAEKRAAPWIKKEWISRSYDSERLMPRGPGSHLSGNAKTIVGSITSGYTEALLTYMNYLAATQQMEYRTPYLDRRLIELLLSVPTRLLFTNGNTKLILKYAVKGVIPEVVYQRESKSALGAAVTHGVQTQERERIETYLGIIDSLPYINREAFNSAWDREFGERGWAPITLLAPLMFADWFDNTEIYRRLHD